MFKGILAILASVIVLGLSASAQSEWKEIPLGYNMANAAWKDIPIGYNIPNAAVPAAPRKSSHYSGNGPDPGRGWEVEFHAGGFFATPSDGGNPVSLPSAAGSPTAVSSWMYGDGAALANAAAANAGVPQRLTGLGGGLLRWFGQRSSGPELGARLSRELTPRFNVELSFDWNTAGIAIDPKVRLNIEQTRSSFENFFGTLAGATSASATSSVKSSVGSQLFWTGALNINLLTKGKNIPYFTIGGGGISNIGPDPHAGILGFYAFDNGAAPHAESDLINLHAHSSRTQGVGVIGIGYKYYATPRVGIRFDVRDHISQNSTDSFLDATPHVFILAPPDLAATLSSPALQFSNDPSAGTSTLSGPALRNFRYWRGSDWVHQVSVSGGVFYRF